MDDRTVELPEYREWSVAAVRLLQGVVYHDDETTWNQILNHRSTLEGYFGRIGLQLIVDHPDGFTYLKQLTAEELPREYEDVPKLTRNTPLSYGASLLCVLLREELRRFEDEEVQHERCVIPAAELYEQWKMFLPPAEDEVKQRRDLDRHLRTLDELKFVRKVNENPEEWEIRRILKARVTAADLESLKEQFLTAARRAKSGNS
jgi:hypothetical protein